MTTKSRQHVYGSSIRASAERAAAARKEADKLACEAWNQRTLGYKGPAQPSPALGDALNAGYRYLEVRCLGCDTHQTVALDIMRRPKRCCRSMSLSVTCAARIARRSVAFRISAAISWRCDRTRSAPASRSQRGGRAKDRHVQRKRLPTEAALLVLRPTLLSALALEHADSAAIGRVKHRAK